jgi:hypothetical protein
MVTKKFGVFIDAPTEERQAEPGPSVFLLLAIIIALAVSFLGIVWLLFFQA